MLVLRTFGTLELTKDDGGPIGGAAAQRKPLLILALAALVPGGIPRERLLRALWPNVDRARARATLKQHLYGLRRATGHPNLLNGTPCLRVSREHLRVDALEFTDHIEHGRLQDAAGLLRGELLEDVTESHGDVLAALVAEIRDHYASGIAMVRQAVAARKLPHPAPSLDGPHHPVPAISGAERELLTAARRFIRGMIALPAEPGAARHRTASVAHDLLEALGQAEADNVPPNEIKLSLADVSAMWQRSRLVQQMTAAPIGEPGGGETLEWLLNGAVRTVDPVGHMLEQFLLESDLAAQLRHRGAWEVQRAACLLGTSHPAPRVLLLGSHGGEHLRAMAALFNVIGAVVILIDSDESTLATARLHMASLADRGTVMGGDIFSQVTQMHESGPFQAIFTGTLLDQVGPRDSKWLISSLLSLLSPDGQLCLSSLAPDDAFGPWRRYIVNWKLAERDRDDIVGLTGDEARRLEFAWHRCATGAWLITLRRRIPDNQRQPKAAA